MFDLTGKTALVTGASGGIGADIARKLHAQGAFVVLHGTRENVLSELASELNTNVAYVTAALNDDDAVNSLIKDAEEKAGNPLDILVNNAGITKDGLVMRMKDADFDAVMTINLRASFKLCRDAIKGMMKRRFGRIINITSVVGVTGNAGQANYCASKAGMIGMSKSMANEVASRGITVNCVAPGFIETPMTDVLTDDQKTKILSNVPAGRLGTGTEIAASVVFLAANESAYITGHTVHVNGGMAMI
ncbi:MAG: 3-oxoacyl-[acyl-carrier protein] reductase [Alphaproteobacteria bacterium]|jgi:3-oxoacyl-[acyl-carrier protein] reductase